MPSHSTPRLAFLATVLIAASVLWSGGRAGLAAAEVGYSGSGLLLTVLPQFPSLGAPVTVSLAGGPPPESSLRWSLSGGAFRNAGVSADSPFAYVFTPEAPGTFTVNVECFDLQGRLLGTSSLEISIGASSGAGGGSPLPSLGEVFLQPSPMQPRLGQTASFTFRFGREIPAGAEVVWTVSGGLYNNLAITGVNKETCSFLPMNQDSYYITAVLRGTDGRPMGEVSLAFIPIP